MDEEAAPFPSMNITKNNKVSGIHQNMKIPHFLQKRWRSIQREHGEEKKKTKGK
jgi:gamma-glutamylcysteine synthetase